MFILVVLGCAIWVYFDSSSLGAKKGLTKGFFDLGPVGWSVSCALLWIVAFPAYLYKRSEIKNANRAVTPPPMRAPVSAPAFNAAEPQTDNLLQLEKLAELKTKGIITEDEFNAKKKQLLAS